MSATLPKTDLSPAAGGPPLISAQDVATAVGLACFALAVWILPERVWPRLSRTCAPLVRRIAFPAFARLGPRIAAFACGRLPATAAEILEAIFLAHPIREMQIAKCRHPLGWKPDIRVQGGEHIDAALAAGNGAVLWDSYFAYATLVTKMGLWRAGYRVSHLSHPRHGYSGTRFGMRCLNRFRTGVETRYLRERVVMGRDSPRAALEALDARLAENGLVSVTVRGESRRPIEVPFFADSILLAPGAANLAHPRNAPVLPVFTLRGADGVFRVNIEAPVRPAEGESREDFQRRLARGYARQLEVYVAADPGQWFGWLDP